MFPPGHYGVALLLYAAVGYVLLERGYRRDAVYGGGIVVAYALFPDLDSHFVGLAHRGVTHTVWFALAVGAVCAVVVSLPALTSGLAADRREAARQREAAVGALWAGFLGTFAVLTHLVADALNPWGVMPAYPVSSRVLSLDAVLATNDVANYVMLGVGTLATLGALVASYGPLDRRSVRERFARWVRTRRAGRR